MRSSARLALTLAAALVLPEAAAAQQTDFLTAKKVACAPERVTRCKAVGVECETKEASARDKAQLLVIDFAGKKAFTRREGKQRDFGDVAEDKVEGDTRTIVLARGPADRRRRMSFRLMKDGKMDGTRNDGRVKMEITCKADE